MCFCNKNWISEFTTSNYVKLFFLTISALKWYRFWSYLFVYIFIKWKYLFSALTWFCLRFTKQFSQKNEKKQCENQNLLRFQNFLWLIKLPMEIELVFQPNKFFWRNQKEEKFILTAKYEVFLENISVLLCLISSRLWIVVKDKFKKQLYLGRWHILMNYKPSENNMSTGLNAYNKLRSCIRFCLLDYLFWILKCLM